MSLKKQILPIVVGVVLYSCGIVKKTSLTSNGRQSNKQSTITKTDTLRVDTLRKPSTKIRPYKDVITTKAITSAGLFKIHNIDNHYFLEIFDTLLNKDILIVNRISKSAAEGRFGPGEFFGYPGDQIGENVVQFSKGPNDKIFIKRISFLEKSNDSTENGMYWSVHNSNLQPIIAVFDIKTISPDSASIVADITDFINGDNDILGFSPYFKKVLFGLGALQPDKSYIQNIQSFPTNLEIRTVKTYSIGDYSYTFELNSSLVLLPTQVKNPRFGDDRVGYFTRGYRDFDNPKGVDKNGTWMITRWWLEPKEEEKEKYLKGELVEPIKPIVFYIDPATPKKWVPYLIQGVNDWQKAFEKAGFKNAIYALKAPINDPEWSMEDARHNVIVYKASAAANAYGPQVNDPRSGEILETHIGWFHNVTKLLHAWYMIQAGAIDPRARKMQFDDALMGQLIRFVCSHEVGHTLGLRHNFGASSTVPVDSLRNKKWVEKNGHTPSIMDYARFNYVAQPEDSITEKGIFPRIGVYDEWAIEWGYRWLPSFPSKEEEKTYMNRWIMERTNKDTRLWYGAEYANSDKRCQSEDLGDNAMKASYYGIKNLKIIMSHLVEWTKEPNSNYDNLDDMQQKVMAQYRRYLFHVARNIGSWQITPKTVEQKGSQGEFTSREQQKEAQKFLQDELFTTPEWVVNKKIFSLVGGNGYLSLIRLQDSILRKILSTNTLGVLLYFETNHPKSAYTVSELLNDLKTGIWSEFKDKRIIEIYRRGLQKVYIAQLLRLQDELGENLKLLYSSPWGSTDLLSIIKGHISDLATEINKTIPLYKDKMSKLHLLDSRDRLRKALNPNSGLSGSSSPYRYGITEITNDYRQFKLNSFPDPGTKNVERKGCWEEK